MNKKDYLNAYQFMLTSRYADDREEILSRQGKSFLQVSSRGHEALAVLSLLLQHDDVLAPYWRNKALVLGKTKSLEGIAREFFATASSSSGGRNMPSHFSDKANNVFSVVTSTGMQCLPACGIAWSFLQRQQSSIVICTIGEGATRQGEFYEAWSFAKEKGLPIVFVVEDNKYAISTPTEKITPLGLNIFSKDDICLVNGCDVQQLYHEGEQAIQQARQGKPSILWCSVDRLSSHTNSDDSQVYRSEEALQAMIDPISEVEKWLVDHEYLASERIHELHKKTKEDVDNLYEMISGEATAKTSSVTDFLYDDSFLYETLTPPNKDFNIPTIVEAVNAALHQGFDQYSDTIGFGQDIEDPKGGVFGFTKGLSTRHPHKIFNAPLSESTIVGTAVGLAACGIKPIFEIQFVDFLGVAFEQLVSQVATLSWRSLGQWSAPLVLYAPYGAYLPGGGMWHSQSNEGFWCHIPGLRVAIPSNPQDAFDLFLMSFQLPDPLLILLPKHIMRKKFDRFPAERLLFGCGQVVQKGSDLSIVAWGNCLSLVSELLTEFNDLHLSIELIDPVFLNPLDFNLIQQSVIKTGRLLVIQEDNRTCSVGESIITKITNNETAFYSLLAAPKLIAREDVHIPYQQDLEYAVLPDKHQILATVKHMVAEV